MKILKILIYLLLPTLCYASPPTRINTYTPNSVISSSDVTENEDALFNYLQSGVDNYVDQSIYNSDINASANIQADKLNLTSISQNIANTGTLTNTGNVTVTGTLNVSSSITVNGVTYATIPTGLISLWSGSIASIPSGWHICDGTNGTPNLLDKMIMHADGSTHAVASTGSPVGAHTHTIDSHTHSLTYKNSGDPRLQTTSDGSDSVGTSYIAGSGTLTTNSTGSTQWYALAYIMKL